MRAAAGTVEVVSSWPLVGRGEELGLIADCVGGGRAGSVVILAAAGVGKTRLATAAADAAREDGIVVLPAVLGTRAAASVPFGAMAELIPDSDDAGAGPRLFRRAAASIRQRGQGRRVLLVVDDAHMLDAQSAALVLHLASDDRVAVVAAVRSGERCLDAVSALWKDRDAVRLDLQPLSEAEVMRLLEAALPGGLIDGCLASAVAARSGGNPLYCRELVRASLAAGAIELADGTWRQTGQMVVGQQLSELVGERVGALNDVERTAMELVVLSELIDLELLEGLVGEHTTAVLEDRQLLEVENSSSAQDRLAHPIYGEVMREQLGELRRRRHSKLLAQTLEDRGRLDRRALLQIATWRLDAGAAEAELLTRAAGAAGALFDHELAVRLASAALERGAGAPAAILLASAQTSRNRFAAAEDALAAWEGQITSEAEGKAYISQRVPLLRWGLDRPADADALLRRAHAWLPSRAWRQYLTAWSVELDQDSGRLEKAARAGQALLAEGDLEPEAELLAAFATPVALLFCGRTHDAQRVANRSFTLAQARAIDLREHAWGALAAWIAVRIETGRDHGTLEPLVHRVHAYAVRHEDDELIGLAEITLGRIAINHGELPLAHTWLTAAVVRLEDCDPRYILGVCLAMLARLEAHGGHADAARDALTRAEATYPAMQKTHWMYRHEYARARAWVAASHGDLESAQHTLLTAADGCDEFTLAEITFLHDALRLEHPAAQLADRLRALAQRTDSELAHAQAAHATAKRHNDAAALEVVAERFAALGTRLLAAEAQSAAARGYAHAGDSRNVRRASQRARELRAACPDARTPPLVSTDKHTLTHRESHIARLAASGLTNHQIAERLVVSVRTVESHLYHAFDKLDITNRAELQTTRTPERAQHPGTEQPLSRPRAH
jgi:DNA-binding NarL/FixJ family response regulator